MSVKAIGLISGMGELPRLIAHDAKLRGYRVVAIAIESVSDISLEPYADFIKSIHVGRLNEIIKTLRRNGVNKAVLAGKFPKTLLYQKKVLPDLRAARVLFSLKDRADDSIINAVAREFEKDGIKLLGITDFCTSLITPEGVLTKKAPGKTEWKDIEFGFRIAKEIGRLDIGQTVVIKDRAVMAVEAIEGTDEAIKRGGRLAGDGVVVVKVIRPRQDVRFDVPVVGLATLNAMKEVNAAVLAAEAGKSIFLERDAFIKEADKAGISLVGYKGGQ